MPYVGRAPSAVPVTADDIPANSIDASKIVDGSIELAEIADNSITDAKLNSSKLDGIADSANNYSHPSAHTVSEVTGLQGLLDGKVDDSQVLTNVPSGALFTDTNTVYTHPTTHATADIADNAITEAKIADAAVVSLKSGRKNLIINGGFNVSQRGDYTTATTAADNVYYLDRFKAVTNGASATVQHINNTTYNSLKMTATSTASGTLGAISFLEEFQKGKTLTASVRMKSNNSNARVLIYDGVSFLATSSTHTGDGSEEIITATGVVSTSATLLRVYTTISTAGVGAVSITSGDYIEIAEVQLEVGSVATDFEHRSYGEELALCMRYYYSTMFLNKANSLTAPTTKGMQLQGTRHRFADVTGYRGQNNTHPVPMRVRPTIVFYNPVNAGASGQFSLYSETGVSQNFAGFVNMDSETGFIFAGYTGVTVGTNGLSTVCYAHWSASAEL